LLVEWENGEITTEPLSVIAADDPITCAVYAREHELLDVKGHLDEQVQFQAKGTGEIEYHLGMSFHRNDRNKLCISPQ
jgi:hypothetical protein